MIRIDLHRYLRFFGVDIIFILTKLLLGDKFADDSNSHYFATICSPMEVSSWRDGVTPESMAQI
jgi:hypothetical protein